jgi:hypothetical protein
MISYNFPSKASVSLLPHTFFVMLLDLRRRVL